MSRRPTGARAIAVRLCLEASAFALLSAAAGCAHSSQAPTSTTYHGQSSIPAGCDRSLSGSWVHENDASFHYEATDDGQTVRLIPHRVNADGTAITDDRVKEMEITLRRRLEGFVGDFRLVETTDTGQTCGVLFQTRITACSAARLTFQVEQSYAVNEACQRIDMGGGQDMVEHVLVRVAP